MFNVDEARWKTYCSDPQFQQYLGTCKDFDPVGIERALHVDEPARKFRFPEGDYWGFSGGLRSRADSAVQARRAPERGSN
jgi:hypothetical protein